MPGVIAPGQKKDALGEIGQVAQLAKMAYDMKGSGAKPGQQPADGAPQGASAPPAAQPDLSAGMAPQNNPGAIDRRIQRSGQDPNAFRGGY